MERTSVILSASQWRGMGAVGTGPNPLMVLVRILSDSAGYAKSAVTSMTRQMEEKGLAAYKRSAGACPTFNRDVGVVEADSLQKRTNHGSAELRANTFLEKKRLSQKDTDERYAVPRGAEEERS